MLRMLLFECKGQVHLPAIVYLHTNSSETMHKKPWLPLGRSLKSEVEGNMLSASPSTPLGAMHQLTTEMCSVSESVTRHVNLDGYRSVIQCGLLCFQCSLWMESRGRMNTKHRTWLLVSHETLFPSKHWIFKKIEGIPSETTKSSIASTQPGSLSRITTIGDYALYVHNGCATL